MATQIQLRGDTYARWASINPILAEKELVVETDRLRLKIGDGIHHYNELSYINVNTNTLVTETEPTVTENDWFSLNTGEEYKNIDGIWITP